jgi:subfamily B ATP-binding cassette protein MsbA
MESLGGVFTAVIIGYGGLQVIEGRLTTGEFFAFIAAALLAYQPLKSLANLNLNLQEGLAAAERVFAVIDAEPTIRNRPGAQTLAGRGGAIRFVNVSFAYGPGKEALRHVSLEVPAGRTVALVGASGAGKSTALNLIPRFYDVDEGAVLIDGTDVRNLTIESLRAQIALVSQEAVLFDDTVRANIAYGRLEASDAELEAAARAAGAHEFIAALPQGYATVIGEHGVKLSGGQRQRLLIARAMLKDAPILLLDEATSALDSESERLVQGALRTLMKGRTVLVIAHRLSTIQDADLIHVMEHGCVVEAGTHGQLLGRVGAYARLYSLQYSIEPAAAEEPGRRAGAAGA